MPTDAELTGQFAVPGPGQKQPLTADDGTNYLQAPAADPHRFYGLSLVLPGAPGITIRYAHPGDETPRPAATTLLHAWQESSVGLDGRRYTTFWVGNFTTSVAPATGTFEVQRLSQ